MPSRTVICIAILALLICWSVGAYNRLVRLKNVIANAFAQLDMQLKRRHDLVPNLVEAAGQYLQHERHTLDTLTSARNQALAASDAVRSKPTSAQTVTALSVAEQELDHSLERFFVLADANPELKADDTIRALREELTSIENQITFAREAYNVAALNYNSAQGQFPALMLAWVFSFVPSATL